MKRLSVSVCSALFVQLDFASVLRRRKKCVEGWSPPIPHPFFAGFLRPGQNIVQRQGQRAYSFVYNAEKYYDMLGCQHSILPKLNQPGIIDDAGKEPRDSSKHGLNQPCAGVVEVTLVP